MYVGSGKRAEGRVSRGWGSTLFNYRDGDDKLLAECEERTLSRDRVALRI